MDCVGYQNIDWISCLPEELILKILSFCEYKVAVQTSVLSKRWVHVWCKLPDPCFEFSRTSSMIRNLEFVNRLLSTNPTFSGITLHGHTDIETYTMITLLQRIINYAASSGFNSLKHVYIGLSSEMYNIYFPTNGAPTQFWNLPALETLTLQLFMFSSGSANSKPFDFFSNFVNLKYLCLLRCRVKDVDVINIHSSSLKTLIIENSFRNQSVVVTAPNLSYFQFAGDWPILLDMRTSHGLEEVVISIRHPTKHQGQYWREVFVNNMLKMFHQLRYAQILKIHWQNSKRMHVLFDMMELCPAPFQKLTCLILDLKDCTDTLADGIKGYFLNSSPEATVRFESTVGELLVQKPSERVAALKKMRRGVHQTEEFQGSGS